MKYPFYFSVSVGNI